MKQLRVTTSTPCSMFGFSQMEPLVKPDNIGELIVSTPDNHIKGKTAYIDDNAEDIAGFDIPIFIDGNMHQLDEPKDNQDILMVLPSGEYPLLAELVDDTYYLTLKSV